MVGDEIGDLSHAVRVQLGDPCIVVFARPDCGVELVVIGDVVAMQTFGTGLEIG